MTTERETMHTPGPWKAVNDTLVRGPHGEPVASTVGFAFPKCVDHAANVRLIAAAPDLLAVAEFVAALCERDGTLANALFSGSGAGAETLQGACLAAIARARGQVTP